MRNLKISQTFNSFANFRSQLVSFVLLIGIWETTAHLSDDSNPYRHYEVLDQRGKYVLEWSVDWNVKSVTFNLTVQTKGYVGFGLSKKGKMSGSDIVIGGVLSDGTPYFSDRHAIGNELPIEDEVQNWKLHQAWENCTHTYLSFSRPFETCDDDHDFPINDDVITIIWAFGENDNEIEYHFQNRGTFYVYLLDPDLTPQRVHEAHRQAERLEKLGDWNVWTMSETQALLPQDTTYLCTFYKAPSHNKKQHIVGGRIILDSDFERRHVHHLLVHKCRPPTGVDARRFFDRFVGRPAEECYVLYLPSNIPQQYCREMTHEWAVGGTPVFFPDHVGIPLSESPDEYYMLQVHYDNPEKIPGIQLNFAVEMYYTPNVRKYDAGIIYTGVATPGAPSIMLPSHSINHPVYGHCGSECTKRMFKKDGVQVFGAIVHTHLAGTGGRLLHVRNGKELPYLVYDDNYIFSYQPIKILREERTVLPGDSLIFRCTYDTSDRNGTATVGGFSSSREMCNSFIWYYPLIRDTVYGVCSSEIRAKEYRDFLQIGNTTWSDAAVEDIVTSPPQNVGLTATEAATRIEWTIDKRNQLKKLQRYLPQVTSCPDIGPDAVVQQTFTTSGSSTVLRRPTPMSKTSSRRFHNDNVIGESTLNSALNEFISVYPKDIIPYEPPRTCRG